VIQVMKAEDFGPQKVNYSEMLKVSLLEISTAVMWALYWEH